MAKRPQITIGPVALNVYGVAFLVFLYAPLALIFFYSFNANPINMAVWSGFTLDWYRTLFGMQPAGAAFDAAFTENPDSIYQVVRNSLIVALSASAISTAIGTATALATARSVAPAEAQSALGEPASHR